MGFLAIIILIIMYTILIFRFKYQSIMSYDELSHIVHRDTIVFSENNISLKVLNRLAKSRVIVVGEYHHIRQHQLFIELLSISLNNKFNFMRLLVEIPQAYSWIFEDYSIGTLPEVNDEEARIFFFDVVNLKSIRKHNSNIPKEMNLKVATIDINHSPIHFIISLKYMMRFVELAILPTLLKDLEDRMKVNSKYVESLKKFELVLKRDKIYYISKLGIKWYKRLDEMICAELYSNKCRILLENKKLARRYKMREDFMKKHIDNYIKDSKNRVVINVGSNHAQKAPINFIKMEWIGEYLTKRSQYSRGSVYCLNIIPAKGTIHNDIKCVNITNSSSSNEIHRIISEYAKDNAGFLSYDDQRFISKNVNINYHLCMKALPPKRQYDGVIVLPYGTFSKKTLSKN